MAVNLAVVAKSWDVFRPTNRYNANIWCHKSECRSINSLMLFVVVVVVEISQEFSMICFVCIEFVDGMGLHGIWFGLVFDCCYLEDMFDFYSI